MMTSLIITGRRITVIIDNGKEILTSEFNYPETLRIVHGFYNQNENDVRKVMCGDNDEIPEPDELMPKKVIKSSTFDELLGSITPKKKVTKGKTLAEVFSDFMPEDNCTPPKTIRYDKSELEEIAESAGIFSGQPSPEDLVAGGMEGDSDEYEADYLAGLKAGVQDRTNGKEAVYLAGDQLGADSNRHAQYIDGYINGYN
jgi:hypothetical protein